MKVLVNSSTDIILNVYERDINWSLFVDCYVIQVDEISDKIVPKGFWRDLKDENNLQIWEETNSTGLLKPSKGFVVSHQIPVKFKRHPNLWTVEEVIKEKYKKKLMNSKFEGLYYQEFITSSDVMFEGTLNFGKKFCVGEGVLIHSLEPSFKDFVLEVEYDKNLPQMFVSSDNQSWCKVDSKVYSHRFKKETNKIYLKLDDTVNTLNAYSIYY